MNTLFFVPSLSSIQAFNLFIYFKLVKLESDRPRVQLVSVGGSLAAALSAVHCCVIWHHLSLDTNSGREATTF